MSNWNLAKILSGLHNDIESRLKTVRETLDHPGTKGDASEKVWLKLLKNYLPARYQAKNAFVVDSQGNFSDQIDVVIFDRQYSPFIFKYQGKPIVPAESVYAVFEAKQTINAEHVAYAQTKVATVRTLHRTSLPIPHAGGVYPPKPLISILGGILTFESEWKPALGERFTESMATEDLNRRLDLGCVAAHGHFSLNNETKQHEISYGSKAATAFLFELISQLQCSGTVPMIDIRAYAKWLTEEST